MTTPQRTAAPALARPAVPTQRPYARPAVPAGQRPLGMRPAAPQPMAPRPVMERPTPRPAVAFLTVVEVAAIMRVSKMTVYRLVHGGELAAVRVGRSFRVPESAVRQYLAGARTDVA
ncbi:helix-turn-helix domain-containing protein [Modestobacter versicolor]|uniref:Excisionase family DNA binding protein n=2 Tax=Modestobacter versicolor TaxID=429133 RepID=A0A839XW55_9ACTN|nr:excisionase family DNA binding protein [Modestobacter versicolor]